MEGGVYSWKYVMYTSITGYASIGTPCVIAHAGSSEREPTIYIPGSLCGKKTAKPKSLTAYSKQIHDSHAFFPWLQAKYD